MSPTRDRPLQEGAGRTSGIALAVAGAATVVAWLWWRHRRAVARRWAAGAEGEQWTADALRSLERRGFRVLHDVVPPGRRWNIDHLVVGRCGVVVVETKRWRGEVRVGRRSIRLDGGRRDDVDAQLAMQVEAVSRAPGTGGPVWSYLCIHGAAVKKRWWVRRRPVGGPDDLVRWIRRLPPAMSRSDVDNTFAALSGWER